MPLTRKGRKIMASMRRSYPTTKKARQVFYASRNAGKITGVDRPRTPLTSDGEARLIGQS